MRALKNKTAIAFAAFLYCFIGAASAELSEDEIFKQDIDLFLTNSDAEPAPPNILIIIDNAGSFNKNTDSGDKRYAVYKDALSQVFINNNGPSAANENIYDGEVSLGLMNWVKSSTNGGGGKVISDVQPLSSTYRQGKLTELMETIDDSPTVDPWKADNTTYGLGFAEAFRYFKSMQVRSGKNDGAGTYDVNALKNSDPASNWYEGPGVEDCAKNYVILIASGDPSSNENNPAEEELAAQGGLTGPVSTANPLLEKSKADEWSRFLSKAHNIDTFVIDTIGEPKSTKEQNAKALLDSIANAGGTGEAFSASDSLTLQSALIAIMEKIQAVNSVFAAASLPISVNVRGTNLNQVYMGVFRPDAYKRPRWMGNLKLYQLAWNAATEQVYLADANGEPAEDTHTGRGFVRDSATSFWTHSSTFWEFAPSGEPASGSDAPDGKVVEKGGAGQRIRDAWAASPNGRRVYTCTGTCASGSLLSLISDGSFHTGNLEITAADLGVSTEAEREALINWVRGQDNKEDENSSGSTSDGDVRASVHGDVLHSQPAVINYNSTGDDQDVVVYYGSNDGLLHAVKGGTSLSDGTEYWSLALAEFFGRYKQLRDNATMDTENPSTYKPYFIDGAVTAYTQDVNNDGKLMPAGGDKVYLYLTMRRGGRFMYALDVSDRAHPKLLWRRGHQDAGFEELAQTWSDPKLVHIRYGTEGALKPVLIFGAGYDPNHDLLPAGSTSEDAMGRGIFVVDAEDGTLLWSAGDDTSMQQYVVGMHHSISSSVTVLTEQVAGQTEQAAYRLYVGDLGGNVWRVDTRNPLTGADSWSVHKLASLGSPEGIRKFMYPPDVVHVPNQGFDAVLFGTGNRERPFDTSVVDRFYMLKDKNPAPAPIASGSSPAALTEDDLYDTTANLIQVGTDAEQAAATEALAAADGWYIKLETGEKVVSSSVALAGTVFFGTNMPNPSSSCTSNLGISRNYMVDFLDGSSTVENNALAGLTTTDRYQENDYGSFPSAPVPVLVEIDGVLRLAVVQGTEVFQPPGSVMNKRTRTFWFEEVDN